MESIIETLSEALIKTSNFSKVSRPQGNSPANRQRSIFLRRRYIHKHFTLSYILFTYMIKCIQHYLMLNIMTSCIMTWRTTYVFAFSGKKTIPKTTTFNCHKFRIRYLYLARAYLRVISFQTRFLYLARARLKSSRFDSCIQPGHIYQLSCFQTRFLYPARAHLHEEIEDQTPVTSQESICLSQIYKFIAKGIFYAIDTSKWHL